jgi:hypothetical protein
MIVRISGEGQFELDDEESRELNTLDQRLVDALNAGDVASFHSALDETVRFVEERGDPVPHDRVVPSEVIIPPRDIDLEEARNFFTDEGLMSPIPA